MVKLRFFLELEIPGMIIDKPLEINSLLFLTMTMAIITIKGEQLLIFKAKISREADNLKLSNINRRFILKGIERFQMLLMGLRYLKVNLYNNNSRTSLSIRSNQWY
jgi:hypothetical protein